MRFIGLLMVLCLRVGAQTPDVQISMIWNQGKHNAFTDLVRFQGAFYCSFREGTGHVPGNHGKDGQVRILRSVRGKKWRSVALLSAPGIDLRDPKLSVTPDGRLMVIMGGTDYDGTTMRKRVPHVAYSGKSGKSFSAPAPVVVDESIRTDWDWLWRVTWQGTSGYGVIYQAQEGDWGLHLVKTQDGKHYESVHSFEIGGKPNEATIRFSPSGEMYMVLRREGADRKGYLGRSQAPYTDWQWEDLGFRLGGPDMILLPDGRCVLGSRVYEEGRYATALFQRNAAGHFEEWVRFPSGGDTSYPGLCWTGKELWVSYYSSHEGAGHEDQTWIYLARLSW